VPPLDADELVTDEELETGVELLDGDLLLDVGGGLEEEPPQVKGAGPGM